MKICLKHRSPWIGFEKIYKELISKNREERNAKSLG